jgi:predicted DNA-binding antitoxin AbrB/MazE fold protein
MSISVEAVYENGVLKPEQPLPFQEHEKVRITVMPAVSHLRRSAGLIGWTGSQEDVDFIALNPDLDPLDESLSSILPVLRLVVSGPGAESTRSARQKMREVENRTCLASLHFGVEPR